MKDFFSFLAVSIVSIVLGALFAVGVVTSSTKYAKGQQIIPLHSTDGLYIIKPDGRQVKWSAEEEAKIPACSPNTPPHTTCTPTAEQQKAEQAERNQLNLAGWIDQSVIEEKRMLAVQIAAGFVQNDRMPAREIAKYSHDIVEEIYKLYPDALPKQAEVKPGPSKRFDQPHFVH